MRCMNCNGDVPPQWVHAIQNNVCPGCGEAIMDEASKELLDELRSAMERMPNDPEGLAGWLLSNYQLRKIGSAEPTEFHRKKQVGHETSRLKIANNPKSPFLARAGMTKEIERRQQMESIVNQVNGAMEDDEPLSVDLDEVDDFEGLDEYEVQALRQSQMSQGASAKRILANNSLVIQGDGRPPTPEEAAAISQALGGNTTAIEGQLPPALQADRFKRLEAQKAVASGGRAGKIMRKD